MAVGRTNRDRVWVNERTVQVDVVGHGTFFLPRHQAEQIATYMVQNTERLERRYYQPSRVFKVIPPEIHDGGMAGWKVAALLKLSPMVLKKLGGAVEPGKSPTPRLPDLKTPQEPTISRGQSERIAEPHSARESRTPRSGIYSIPDRLRQLNKQLESRFGSDGGTPLRKAKLRPLPDELLREVRAAENRALAAALAAGLTRRVLRDLLAHIPHLDDDSMAERAAEVVAAGAPRTFQRRAVHILKTMLLSPAGRVAARVFLERAGADAPRFWRVMASSEVKGDLHAVTAMLAEVDRWNALCEQNKLPMEAPRGAGVAVAIAVMSSGSRDLLHRQGEQALISALGHVDVEQWPPCLGNFFGHFNPLNYRELTRMVVLKIGHPRTSGHPVWKRVAPAVRDKIGQFLDERLRPLNRFFMGSNERATFWRDYACYMLQVKPVLEDEAVIMDFSTFGVVEFNETGNATYFYSPKAIRSFLRGHHRWANDLKRRDMEGYLFKLSHYQGWQANFARRLKELI